MKLRHRGTAQQFDNWYESIATEKKYPVIGRNARTGLLAPDKCQTTAYSKKEAHPENKDDYTWIFGDYEDKSLLDLTEQEAVNAGFVGVA